MTYVIVGTTAIKVIEHNPKRKFITFHNAHATQLIYLSDEPGPTVTDMKWIIPAGEKYTIDRETGFPERAFYAIASGASTGLAIGFQNEE